MVRINGQVMTDVRYMELQNEYKSLNLLAKSNIYFFGERHICRSDLIWFYGIPVVVGTMACILSLTILLQ